MKYVNDSHYQCFITSLGIFELKHILQSMTNIFQMLIWQVTSQFSPILEANWQNDIEKEVWRKDVNKKMSWILDYFSMSLNVYLLYIYIYVGNQTQNDNLSSFQLFDDQINFYNGC
jgi:hypothetical protein